MKSRFALLRVTKPGLVAAVAAVGLLMISVSLGAGNAPSFEEYATIEGWSNGVPIYSFANVVYVYGVCPDFLPGVVMQEGNNHPVVKIKPKKSWELKDNFCGTTQPEPAMRTMWNDDQPYLPIHLIDGDPDTCWGAFGISVPDERPEWIQVTLPVESTVASVSLVCPKRLPRGGRGLVAGKLLPRDLTIQITRDTAHWETVYENKDFTGNDSGPNVIEFKTPVKAKQIKIIGADLMETNLGDYLPYTFSIGEVEVLDTAGKNLALISNGAGVAVSSTTAVFSENRMMTDAILPPTTFDLGYKWMRQGLDNGVFLWQYVERDKGKLKMDERADRWVTEINRAGVNFVLSLDIKGNWNYTTPPDEKSDWRKMRTRVSYGLYEDCPPFVGSDPNQLEGYLRYVEYMARHFKGRIAYYEIGNEQDTRNMDDYIKVYKAAYRTIKKADPRAKIMVGSLSVGRIDSFLTRWGPGSGVRDGKLIAKGRLMAVPEGVKLKDGTVSVDAESQMPVGILLRYKDRGNCLIASYNPLKKAIEFYELVKDTQIQYSCFSVDPVCVVPVGGLGPQVRLTARVEGSRVTLTISDGKNAVTASHDIKEKGLLQAGHVGLCRIPFCDNSSGYPSSGLHCGVNPLHRESLVSGDGWFATVGTFDNLEVKDSAGEVIYRDDFSVTESDGSDGRAQPRGWRAYIGHWDKEGVLKITDGIGWHMAGFSWNPVGCADVIKEARRDLAVLGFKGVLMANEIYHRSWYPPPAYHGWPENQIKTEMEMAKNLARDMIGHLGADVYPSYCNTYRMGLPCTHTVYRKPKPGDAVGYGEPKPAYYMLRSVCTAMEGYRVAGFPVTFSEEDKFVCFTFKRGDGDLLLATWANGLPTTDVVSNSKSDITIKGVRAKRASVIDLINGTEQELDFLLSGKDTMIKNLLIQDYPVLVRIEE